MNDVVGISCTKVLAHSSDRNPQLTFKLVNISTLLLIDISMSIPDIGVGSFFEQQLIFYVSAHILGTKCSVKSVSSCIFTFQCFH